MSTCHQAHNIPWNSFVELLHKVPTQEYFYGNVINQGEVIHDLVFTPDADGRIFNKIKHFASKIESAIKEFSKTERAKYKNEDIDKITKIFDKESCINKDWLRYESDKLQEVSGWEKNPYNALETTKELFIQDNVPGLLAIARKGVELERITHVTYSNFFHYGIGRLKEDCLTIYIHLNILLANGTLQDPSKWHGQWRSFLQREILWSNDGTSQSRMYKQYFEKNPNFEDLEGLQDLLKKLFRMLYVYDMIMIGERGMNFSWQTEVLSCAAYFLDRTRANHSLWYKQTDEFYLK